MTRAARHVIQLRGKQAGRVGAENWTPDDNEEAGQKVVFVRAPTTFKYGEVIKVIEAIKAVGGRPIGLQNPDADQGGG